MTHLTPVNYGATVLLGRYLDRRRRPCDDADSGRVRQGEARPQVGCSRAADVVAPAGPAVAAAGQDDPGGVRRAGQLGGE